MSAPFLKLVRGPVVEQLVRHPKAFALLTLAALRARRTGEIRLDDIKVGEAMMGDYESCGNTRQEFRTNLERLKEWGFIATRSTNRGTVVKINNTEVYDTNSVVVNQPINQPATSQQPASNQLATTNKNLLLQIEQLSAALKKKEEERQNERTEHASVRSSLEKKIGELEDEKAGLQESVEQLEYQNGQLKASLLAQRPASHTGGRGAKDPIHFSAFAQSKYANEAAFSELATKLGYPSAYVPYYLAQVKLKTAGLDDRTPEGWQNFIDNFLHNDSKRSSLVTKDPGTQSPQAHAITRTGNPAAPAGGQVGKRRNAVEEARALIQARRDPSFRS